MRTPHASRQTSETTPLLPNSRATSSYSIRSLLTFTRKKLSSISSYFQKVLNSQRNTTQPESINPIQIASPSRNISINATSKPIIALSNPSLTKVPQTPNGQDKTTVHTLDSTLIQDKVVVDEALIKKFKAKLPISTLLPSNKEVTAELLLYTSAELGFPGIIKEILTEYKISDNAKIKACELILLNASKNFLKAKEILDFLVNQITPQALPLKRGKSLLTLALETGHKELANIILRTNLRLPVNEDLIVLAINNNMCSIVPAIREGLKRSGIDVPTIQYMHNIAISEHKFSEEDIEIITEEINKLPPQDYYRNSICLHRLKDQVEGLLGQQDFLKKNTPIIQAITQKFPTLNQVLIVSKDVAGIGIGTTLPETKDSKTSHHIRSKSKVRQDNTCFEIEGFDENFSSLSKNFIDAIKAGSQKRITSLLIKHNSFSGNKEFFLEALRNKQWDILELLFKWLITTQPMLLPNLDTPDVNKKTLLMYLVQESAPQASIFLQKMLSLVITTLDLNQQDDEGKTALHYATEGIGQQCMIKQLLKAGASTTIPDNKNRTPLELVAASSAMPSKDDAQAANFILKALYKEADTETFTSICARCINAAHEAGNVRITELLLNYKTCSKDQLNILINKTLTQIKLRYPTTSMITILLDFRNSLEPAGSSYDATCHLDTLISSAKKLLNENEEEFLTKKPNKETTAALLKYCQNNNKYHIPIHTLLVEAPFLTDRDCIPLINQAPETNKNDRIHALMHVVRKNRKTLITHLLEKYVQDVDSSLLILVANYLINFDLQAKKIIYNKLKSTPFHSSMTNNIYANLTLQITAEEYFDFGVPNLEAIATLSKAINITEKPDLALYVLKFSLGEHLTKNSSTKDISIKGEKNIDILDKFSSAFLFSQEHINLLYSIITKITGSLWKLKPKDLEFLRSLEKALERKKELLSRKRLGETFFQTYQRIQDSLRNELNSNNSVQHSQRK